MAISTKISSMKRLYEAGKTTKEQLIERVQNGKLTEEEYEIITGEKYGAEDTGEESTE